MITTNVTTRILRMSLGFTKILLQLVTKLTSLQKITKKQIAFKFTYDYGKAEKSLKNS